MNIRKNVDYSEMYDALDKAVKSGCEQMQMYARIGNIVNAREEKGAAVAAAEHLQERYPDIPGFSPRNLRRMRELWRTYGQDAEALNLAMQIGWTQNVVILEAELTMQERAWYLREVAAHDWSKKVLVENILNAIHLNVVLDDSTYPCYTDKENTASVSYDEENGICRPDSIEDADGRYDKDTFRPVVRILRERGLAAPERRLRLLRPPDRHRASRPPGYVPHLRRRLLREDVPPDRVYRPPRDQCQLMCRTSDIHVGGVCTHGTTG